MQFGPVCRLDVPRECAGEVEAVVFPQPDPKSSPAHGLVPREHRRPVGVHCALFVLKTHHRARVGFIHGRRLAWQAVGFWEWKEATFPKAPRVVVGPHA
eukprot:15235226-Heterocapsa_arctica.AAC.1